MKPYNVDKVIEELKSNALLVYAQYEDGICSSDSYKIISLHKAIEIVKRGGEDDRVRETESP